MTIPLKNGVVCKSLWGRTSLPKKGSDQTIENGMEFSTFETVLKRLILKDKKMYKHITKAGEKFQLAMFKYYEPLINQELVPENYNHTKLFGLWKGKGSELDLNMMRYIQIYMRKTGMQLYPTYKLRL